MIVPVGYISYNWFVIILASIEVYLGYYTFKNVSVFVHCWDIGVIDVSLSIGVSSCNVCIYDSIAILDYGHIVLRCRRYPFDIRVLVWGCVCYHI